jgi:hypothetical protein
MKNVQPRIQNEKMLGSGKDPQHDIIYAEYSPVIQQIAVPTA